MTFMRGGLASGRRHARWPLLTRKTALRSFLTVSLFAIGIVAAVLANVPGASGKQPPGTTSSTTAPTTTWSTTVSPSQPAARWSADHEEGNLADWYSPAKAETTSVPHGGGEYNSGVADSIASQTMVRSGSSAAKQTIDTSGGSAGTRLARWEEFRALAAGQPATASVWVYLPATVKVGGYFNLFQFKSKTQDERYIDVFFQANLVNRTDGSLYLKVAWGCGAENPAFPAGPYQGTAGLCTFYPPLATVNVPVGRWFQISAVIVPSAGYGGRYLLYQDSTLLYDFENVRTGYANTNSSNGVDTQWAVNAYANGLTPSVYTQYVDDAQVMMG